MTILADAHTPRPAAARGPPPAGMAEDDGDEFAELERAETGSMSSVGVSSDEALHDMSMLHRILFVEA